MKLKVINFILAVLSIFGLYWGAVADNMSMLVFSGVMYLGALMSLYSKEDSDDKGR